MRLARRLHPAPEGRWYLFLDEVTSIPQWQRGVKVAWDQGLTREDFVLLTGSSAHDLRSGAEQLPGRRGKGNGNTAREYVEFLSESFALLTVFFWDMAGGALQPSKQRTVYSMDPLLAAIPALLMPGARRPPGDGIVENFL